MSYQVRLTSSPRGGEALGHVLPYNEFSGATYRHLDFVVDLPLRLDQFVNLTGDADLERLGPGGIGSAIEQDGEPFFANPSEVILDSIEPMVGVEIVDHRPVFVVAVTRHAAVRHEVRLDRLRGKDAATVAVNTF